jgi:hypothetical protein
MEALQALRQAIHSLWTNRGVQHIQAEEVLLEGLR